MLGLNDGDKLSLIEGLILGDKLGLILAEGDCDGDILDEILGLKDGLTEGDNEVIVKVIGGRKNILGPLHRVWEGWTGPTQFEPGDDWLEEYQLTDHGLLSPIVIETLR